MWTFKVGTEVKKKNKNHQQQLHTGKADQTDGDLMRDLGWKIFYACVFMSTLRPCRDNSLKASVMRRVFLSHQLTPHPFSSHLLFLPFSFTWCASS